MTEKFLFFDWIFLQRKTSVPGISPGMQAAGAYPPWLSFFPSDAIGVLLC